MKKLLLLLSLALGPWLAQAHDHLDVGLAAGNPTRLALTGKTSQLATYFPLGEAPSAYLASFPGGAYACALTFSAFDNTSPPPLGAMVRIEILSVTGPTGGSFSFWEAGATAPTSTRPSGWTAAGADQPAFFASEDGTGYGHLHGRVFTTNRPGVYDVTFRVVDTLGRYPASVPVVVRFTAIAPPQLAISKVGQDIKLTFTSRADLSYDMQSSTTLNANDWTTIATQDGTGGLLEFTDPIASRPRVFYRLVEY